jgi:epoxyqueuosine reductase
LKLDDLKLQQDSEELRREILGMGAALVGFADMSSVPSLPFPGEPRAISVAVQLAPSIIEAVRQGPTAESALEYDRVNGGLDGIAGKICDRLRVLGYRADFFPATLYGAALESPAYQRDLRAQFQHKTAATLAGLGWIGKSAILVTPEYGPRIRLVTVFTDLALATGEPIVKSRCGDCTECIDACPGNVIKGRRWEVGVPREALVDVHGCQAASRQIALTRTGKKGPCGMCVAACPWGHE